MQMMLIIILKVGQIEGYLMTNFGNSLADVKIILCCVADGRTICKKFIRCLGPRPELARPKALEIFKAVSIGFRFSSAVQSVTVNVVT